MSVFKKVNPSGKIRWVAQVHDPDQGRARQIGTYATRRDAQAAERDAVAKRLTHAVTVGEWAERWPEQFPTSKLSTRMTRLERLKPLVRDFGHRRMDSITVVEARAWALEHRHQYGEARAMWNAARQVGLSEHNPFAKLGLSQPRGRRDIESGWLNSVQVEEIADHALRALEDNYAPIFRAAVIFAAFTGVRPGELYALEWSDLGTDTVDVARGACSKSRTVGTPKNSYARTIVYPAQAREAVESMPRLHDVDLVFPSPRGKQFWASTFGRYWDKVRASAHRPDMDFYELRHFCATHLLERGVSAADVAVQLGHLDGGTLVMSTYGHPSDIAARARVRAALDGYHHGEIAELRDRRSGS